MSELKYTLTLTFDDLFALSKALYQQTRQNEEDAALFQNNCPELYKIVTRDLKEGQHLLEIVETALCAPSFEEDEQ